MALIVHQSLEGLSLGSVLALTPFSTAKKVAMVLFYALTTSLGIAIGGAPPAVYRPGQPLTGPARG
jgi:zinc transporter ZupT